MLRGRPLLMAAHQLTVYCSSNLQFAIFIFQFAINGLLLRTSIGTMTDVVSLSSTGGEGRGEEAYFEERYDRITAKNAAEQTLCCPET
jgi:hypothetical protein